MTRKRSSVQSAGATERRATHDGNRRPVTAALRDLSLRPRAGPGLISDDGQGDATDFQLVVPLSSLLDCLGRVRRVKAKPHAVASRALTRRPHTEGRQLSRRTRGGPGRGHQLRPDRGPPCH